MLTDRAGEDLLASYDTERRPHARAMAKKAVRVGWAMTGGQDRAAAVRQIALAAAVRSEHVRQAMASTATPPLKAGALQAVPLLQTDIPAALRPGGLIPNPLVSTGDGPPTRLDTILARRTAVLTARRPGLGLVEFCRHHGLVLVRISGPGTRTPGRPRTQEDAGRTEVRLADDAPPAGMRALTANPALTIIVRPDRVVATAEPRPRMPHLPWYIPATAGTPSPAAAGTPSPAAAGTPSPAAAPPPGCPAPAGPLPAVS